MSLVLIDKSAYVRGDVAVPETDELCLCAVTRLELLFSARSAHDYELLQVDLQEFRDLRMDAETFAVALGAQRELAARAQHRVPIPDLLIGSCAQQHGADVLHVDRHYDALAQVLAFCPRRPGSQN
ncbi:MAG: PIN domain-containing protein [Actinomycetota bacterium]|nr:PIN domain-containing protein [Actinomycetota bacterium]